MTSGVWGSRWFMGAVLIMDKEGHIAKWTIQDVSGSVTVTETVDPSLEIWPPTARAWPGDARLTVTLSGLVIPTPPL